MTTTTRNKTVTTLALSVLCMLPIVRTHATGLTLITHGLNGNANGWVTAMANRIPLYPTFPGTSHTFYKLYFVSAGAGNYQMAWSRAGGVPPAVNDSGEIIVALDWGPLANGSVFTTYDVAGYVSSALQNPNFISELNGRALCELPVHMVGHSRGGSLVAELSFRLGTNGLWVDHLTTLDPHPLNDPSFPLDFLISSVVDAPARTYQNVLFHDNYWQDLDAFVYGKSVPGAYVRELYNLSGGSTSSHSDVHLWYHATVDQRNPADNSEAQLNRTASAWYSNYENSGYNAGYKWSRIGGGNRMSLDQPYGAGSASIVQGYNGAWDLGSGLAANRTALPNNDGSWPNVIRMNCTSGAVAAKDTEIAIDYYYQWAQPPTSNATVTLYLDTDRNPCNGMAGILSTTTVPGIGASSVGRQTLRPRLATTNIPSDRYAIGAMITAAGKSRYAYAPELLTVVPAEVPPSLAAILDGQNILLSWPTNAPGYALQWTTNVASESWNDAATTPSLIGGHYVVPQDASAGIRFFRLNK